MPATAQAALVFLVIVVPGFLAIAGYRLGRAVPDHPEGLATTARVISASAFIAVIAWRLGGRGVFDDVRAGTALTTHQADTLRLAMALLLAPGVVGFLLGELVDAMTHRVWSARAALKSGLPAEPRSDSFAGRIGRMCLTILPTRLLPAGPTTWDRAWRQTLRDDSRVFVRVTTKGGRKIVGLIGDDSQIGLSPQPRDLFIEQTFREASDGRFHRTACGLGTFVSGGEIEAVEWLSRQSEVTHV